MYGYIAWPGVYSFKDEIGLLMKYFKEQIEDILRKIEETEAEIEDVQLFETGMKKYISDSVQVLCTNLF